MLRAKCTDIRYLQRISNIPAPRAPSPDFVGSSLPEGALERASFFEPPPSGEVAGAKTDPVFSPCPPGGRFMEAARLPLHVCARRVAEGVDPYHAPTARFIFSSSGGKEQVRRCCDKATARRHSFSYVEGMSLGVAKHYAAMFLPPSRLFDLPSGGKEQARRCCRCKSKVKT